MDTVEVEFSHPHDDYDVGDRAVVHVLEAKSLVRAGVAVYPTKADAVEAEGEAGAEKTKRAVAKKATGRT
jgi:hypothetical protein